MYVHGVGWDGLAVAIVTNGDNNCAGDMDRNEAEARRAERRRQMVSSEGKTKQNQDVEEKVVKDTHSLEIQKCRQKTE